MQTTNIKSKKNFLGFKRAPSTIIAFRYSLIALVITLILMGIIPEVLNYGPQTINTPFDIQMSYISYNTQFFILATIIILAIIISNKIMLRDVDKWYKDDKKTKFTDLDRLQAIRKKCLTLPYLFFAIEVLVPSTVAFIILSITGSHSAIMIGKIILLLMSFSLLLAVVSFIFSKNLYDSILEKTYIPGFDIGIRVNLKKRIFLLIFPIILAGIFILALIAYSSSIQEKENTLVYIYQNHLENYFNTSKTYTLDEIINISNTIKTISDTDTIFILSETGEKTLITGNNLSNFIIEYTLQLSESQNGRIYDSYGVDTQGSTLKLTTPTGEKYYIGITYEVIAKDTLTILGATVTFLISVSLVILYIFANSLTNNIHQITMGFQRIVDNTDSTSLLPVISNDEIGDLTQSFNDIQRLNTALVQNIKDNQIMLIEKERLASLGQMIGGIAHNLKTPIFSVSGGLEGLKDLIDEFDSSIEDPTVNNQDMHDIAEDMKKWVEKLKNHVSYMSDVITAVKGQAVTLSEENDIEFTIEELFKHIDILMKHEVKNALVTLNLENNVNDAIHLQGNINSLVQIINNIISNAIEAYHGATNKAINVKAIADNKNITITVTDFASGIAPEVKEKLFKEMITTKGKDGTGLGLFMSYSTIKANFHGNMSVESELNKGTTFTITLPYKN